MSRLSRLQNCALPHSAPARRVKETEKGRIAEVDASRGTSAAAALTPVWNWKTALWSGLYRAPAFIAASWKSGFPAAVQAGGLEFVLFGAMAGFTGALTQRFRHYQPVWKQRLMILGVIPLCLHTVEWCGHRLSGTPGRNRGVLISVGMTVLAVSFNWFAMRRGALLAGKEGHSFLEDMKKMPALAAGFLAWISGRER